MNFKKKLLLLLICVFVAFFAISCSCGGDTEKVKTDTTASTQRVTDENEKTVETAQSDSQQNISVLTDETVNTENSYTEKSTGNSSTEDDNTKTDNVGADAEDTKQTESTQNQSNDDKTADDAEEPLYNAEAVFDEDDFEFE